MKIRTDFVTNSSSSSYIIGKPEEYTTTLDEVYQKVREIFRQYAANQQKEAEQYLSAPILGTTLEKVGKYFYKLTVTDWHAAWETGYSSNKYPCLVYSGEVTTLDWLDCETYEEFLEQTKDMPFLIRIFDLMNESIRCVSEWTRYCAEALEWYDLLPNEMDVVYFYSVITASDDCTSCVNREYCFKDFEGVLCSECNFSDACGKSSGYGTPGCVKHCQKGRKYLSDLGITKDNVFHKLLGQVMISSHDVPWWVFDELEKISVRCCHMG